MDTKNNIITAIGIEIRGLKIPCLQERERHREVASGNLEILLQSEIPEMHGPKENPGVGNPWALYP